MGKIVCFTGADISSKLVKLALESRDIPYIEVSIKQYPSKYAALKALTFSESLPQVFFNTRLIGGVEETTRQLESWDNDKKYKTAKAKYEGQIARAGEPKSIMSLVPTDEQKPEVPIPADLDRVPSLPIELPDGTKTSIVDITEKLKNSLPQEDHSYKNVVYRKTFSGGAAGKVFIDSLDISPQHAVAFGQHLLDAGVFLPIGQTNDFVGDKKSVYRLQCYSHGKVLNSYFAWVANESVDTAKLVQELDDMLTRIEVDSFSKEGKIDYTKAASHAKFAQFEYEACALQSVRLETLSNTELTALGLNLYKIMLRYAFIKVGIGKTENDRLTLLQNVRFDVGGFTFTFREWVDGILRGNKRATYAARPPFERKDERFKFCLPKLDYRIHFALNQDPRFGSMSALPFSVFTAEKIDEQLQIASRVFFSDSRNVDLHDDRDLGLPRFFAWYRSDFADDGVLVEIISGYLGTNKQAIFRRKVATNLKFRHIETDWTRIAVNYFPFEKAALKSEIKGMAKLLQRFTPPKTPAIESLRLATLHSLNLLDTLPEERFDRITRMVRHEFDMPVVLVSLVDANRQWFKSKQWYCKAGEVDETGRDISFCGHAILKKADDIFIIEDALEDDRFADNPLVTGDFGLRFYAGCNLSITTPGSDEPVNIGTLCCIDQKPRKFTESDIQKLRVYAFRIRREIRRNQGGDTGSVTSASSFGSGNTGSAEMTIKV
mmetsp:Transcript_63398/g.95699  ORF Transcript_63398/g.95699 Transcript_63398/m.95699 type:complete len:718 (-) Transcript_63398:58-2211(-)